MRIVEPELPQSSGALDGEKLPPVPVTRYAAIFEPFHLCAQRGDAAQAAGAVGAGGEIGEAAGALGQPGEHGVAVGDTFVARQAQRSGQVARGLDDAFGHDFEQDGLLKCSISIVSSGTTAVA